MAVALGLWDAPDRRLLAAVLIRKPLRDEAKPARLVTAARDLMAVGGDTVRLLFLIGCVAGLIADRRGATAGLLVLVVVSARAALFAIKRVVRRPRPDADARHTVTYTSSFPSGHTFMAVVLFLSTALLVPTAEQAAVMTTAIVLALLTGALIGAVRVAFGVHWPSDVVAGWIAGIAWTSGCLLLARSLA